MAKGRKKSQATQEIAPRSLPLAAKGIRTGFDFAEMMSAVMSDTIEGRLSPGVANAVCNAGSKLLKVVEMQFRYGRKIEGTDERILSLVPMSAPMPQMSEKVQ